MNELNTQIIATLKGALSGGFAVSLLLMVGLVTVLQVVLNRSHARKRRAARSAAGADASPTEAKKRRFMANPKHQMDAVAEAGFQRKPLLNREEARLLPVIEQAARSFGAGHRVMAQTSLAELILPLSAEPDDQLSRDALAAINSKRVDFSVIDRTGLAVCVIEYQGGGHHQGRAFMRDAVKREALRKAGVPMIEITPAMAKEQVAQLVGHAIVAAGGVSMPTATVA